VLEGLLFPQKLVILPAMLVKTSAIVLHAFRYGESRLIADVFTRDEGRLSLILNLPRTSKGKMRRHLFQPLTLLDIEVDLRPRLQLQSLRNARLQTPFCSIPFESSKTAITLFLAEFLYHALKGEQRNIPLYDYVESSLEWLDSCNEHYANFHLVFLMRLSRFLGFYPNLENYEPGCCFDLRAGVFSTAPFSHHDILTPPEAAKLQLLMRMDYPTMHLFCMTHVERQMLIGAALKYYQLHLPDFPELRSLDVLKELYRDG
jgi:DNA repair protein RecO (recombination protein O)